MAWASNTRRYGTCSPSNSVASSFGSDSMLPPANFICPPPLHFLSCAFPAAWSATVLAVLHDKAAVRLLRSSSAFSYQYVWFSIERVHRGAISAPLPHGSVAARCFLLSIAAEWSRWRESFALISFCVKFRKCVVRTSHHCSPAFHGEYILRVSQ